MQKQMIDLAYDLARTKYQKKAFTFNQLWKDLIKKVRLDVEEQEMVGIVYTQMLQDHRFIFIGNDEWKLREYLTVDEQNGLANKLYDFTPATEEGAKIADINDKDMAEQEMYYNDEELEEMYKENQQHLDDEDDEDAGDEIEESESEDEEEPEEQEDEE